jgi:uncharacterized protein involved in type VI secretion and phage assembly
MSAFQVRSGVFREVRWTVISIVGEEALSELFSFTMHVMASRAELAEHAHGVEPIELALAGQTVRFRVHEQGVVRYGVVAAAHLEPPVFARTHEHDHEEQYSRLRIEVVPRAWLLTQRRNSRIFQHWYPHQIVSQILFESNIKHRWALTNTYRKRVYCVQYDETDYEFVSRLLAEEGVLFFFEHVDDPKAFKGGPVPQFLTSPSTLQSVAAGFAGAGKLLTGIGDLGENNPVMQDMSMAGRAADVASDAMTEPTDEEADDPTPIQPGEAGPGGEGDVFVFTDNGGGYRSSMRAEHDDHDDAHAPDARLVLHFRDDAELNGDLGTVTAFQPAQRVRSKSVDLREYDFRRPLLLLEYGQQQKNDPSVTPDPTWHVDGDPPLEVYAHHGEYETPELDPQLASLYLDQVRADARTMGGKSFSPRLQPGYAFKLVNNTRVNLHDNELAVIRVRHEWYSPMQSGRRDGPGPDLDPFVEGCARAIHQALMGREMLGEEAIRRIIHQEAGDSRKRHHTYHCSFECVRGDIAYRPPRPKRVPRNVTESATVVGPIGIPSTAFAPRSPDDPMAQLSANEIYVDQYGRVKIQFHWDREGKLNENSSCWVRVLQTWSGAGFGFQFVPRIGMEVTNRTRSREAKPRAAPRGAPA